MTYRQRWILAAAAVAWFAAFLGGGTVLYRYAYAVGEKEGVTPLWPEKSLLEKNPAGDTLVVSVHPQCPCTRASMVELNDLMLSLRGKVKAYVLVIRPHEFPKGWENTEVVAEARRIPGTTVVMDRDGAESNRFGTQTSGQAVLYDREGRLMFNGGLTASRGHIGDNAGLQRIASLVNTGKADKNDSLVFGCPLNAKSCPMLKTDKTQVNLKGETYDN